MFADAEAVSVDWQGWRGVPDTRVPGTLFRMGTVEVVDRGSLEIVVFMSGGIDDSTQADMDSAVEAVTRLEPQRVVVDTHDASSFGPAGVDFLDALRSRGRAEGFEVDLAAISPEVRPVLESAGWIHPVLHPHG